MGITIISSILYNDYVKRISIAENVYKPPLLSSYPALGSNRIVLRIVTSYFEKIHHLWWICGNISQRAYLWQLFLIYKYGLDVVIL